jgi:hypothetical protein
MRYRALTIAREFGSGGAMIAREVATRLNWKLLDNALVLEAARLANVDPTLVRRLTKSPTPGSTVLPAAPSTPGP